MPGSMRAELRSLLQQVRSARNITGALRSGGGPPGGLRAFFADAPAIPSRPRATLAKNSDVAVNAEASGAVGGGASSRNRGLATTDAP